MICKVWLISDNGDGIPQELQDWDCDENLTLRLSAFANNAVIEIEPRFDLTLPTIKKEKTE